MDTQVSKTKNALVESGSTASSGRMHPALEAALTENHREFLGFLVRRLGDRDTAEDVLQQFYLRVISHGSGLRKTDSVVAWLYTVLRTTLIDHYRREATRRDRETDYAVMQSVAEQNWDAGPESDTGICGCMGGVISTLKPEYADLLQRVDLSESAPRKVAGDLRVSPNNLRVRLHRARQSLKHALLKKCGKCAEQGGLDCDCNHGGSHSCAA